MRELKFRAWFKDDERMYYQIENTASTMNGLERFCQLVGSAKGYTPEVMQYTGLKDKNGKEIYEGDIVMVRQQGAIHKPYKVFYNSEIACFVMSYYPTGTPSVGIAGYKLEVIGNIYENGDLLK